MKNLPYPKNHRRNKWFIFGLIVVILACNSISTPIIKSPNTYSGASPSPISSTIVPGNQQSLDCASFDLPDRHNGEEVIRWMVEIIETNQIDRSACLMTKLIRPIQGPDTYYEYNVYYEYSIENWGKEQLLVSQSEYLQDVRVRLPSSSVRCRGIRREDIRPEYNHLIFIWTSGWSPPWSFLTWPQVGPDVFFTPDSEDVTFLLTLDDIWTLIHIILDTNSYMYSDNTMKPCH